jgi:hypothetical protein
VRPAAVHPLCGAHTSPPAPPVPWGPPQNNQMTSDADASLLTSLFPTSPRLRRACVLHVPTGTPRHLALPAGCLDALGSIWLFLRRPFLPISSELHRTRAPTVWRAHLPACASGALASLMVCALATPSSSSSFLGGGAESAAADRKRCGRAMLAGWQPKSGLVAICYAGIPLSTRPPTACCSTTRHALSRSQRLRGDSSAEEPTRNPG